MLCAVKKRDEGMERVSEDGVLVSLMMSRIRLTVCEGFPAVQTLLLCEGLSRDTPSISTLLCGAGEGSGA